MLRLMGRPPTSVGKLDLPGATAALVPGQDQVPGPSNAPQAPPPAPTRHAGDEVLGQRCEELTSR